jgi:uncharacterized protein (TIGR04222 family)
MNPLDLKGPDFLMAYVVLLAVAYGAARVWQSLQRTPLGTPEPFELDLDPYEVAALQGTDAVAQTAVAALIQEGRLRTEGGDRLVVGGKLASSAHPIERAVYQTVTSGGAGHAELRRAVETRMEKLEESLHRRGFLLRPEQEQRLKWTSLLVFTAAMALGVMKLLIGISRDRPVLFLAVLLCVAGFLGYASLVKSAKGRRSGRGEAALELLREKHQPLRMTVTSEGATLNGGHMALAVALYGGSVLATSTSADMRNAMNIANGWTTPIPGGTHFSGVSSCGEDSGGGASSTNEVGSSSCGSSGDGGGGGSGCGGCGGGGSSGD